MMKIYQPRKELRPYVRYYWVLESDEPFSVLTFPIGCPQIIFHKKTPLYIPEIDKNQSEFTISGQVNFPAHLQSDGSLDMIVVVFHPHTIGIFIDTPPSAFYNLEISGYDIEKRQLNEIARKIFDSEDNNICIDTLERFLLSKIRPSININRIGESINSLLRHPSMPVNLLANAACLCKRQYERVFRDTIGMNPKRICPHSAISESNVAYAKRRNKFCGHSCRMWLFRSVSLNKKFQGTKRSYTRIAS